MNEAPKAATPNTVIYYLYRDASNYKKQNTAFVAGTFTDEEKAEMLDCCDNGMYFIPAQIGLPESRFDETTEDDHVWMELEESSFEEATDEVTPYCTTTAAAVLEGFRKAKGHWDVAAAMERLGL